MNPMRTIVTLSLVLVVATANEAAGPKHNHAAHGRVVAVHRGKNGDGLIAIRTHHHRKSGAAGQNAAAGSTERRFHVTGATQFQKVIHTGKGQKQTQPATFADIHRGENVVVVSDGKDHTATKVAIIVHVGGKGKGT